MKNGKTSWTYPVAVLAILLLAAPCFASAQTATDMGTRKTMVLHVPLGKSRVLRLKREAEKVSVGNPNVADVLILEARQLYIVGKSPGTTNVAAWDGKGMSFAVIDVEVTYDLEALRAKLHELFPDERPKVQSVQGALVLSGEISSLARMDAIEKVARSFIETQPPAAGGGGSGGGGQSPPAYQVQGTQGGMPTSYTMNPTGGQGKEGARVINLMQVGGGQQVMLEVKVAEVSRNVLRRLGIRFNALSFRSPWFLGGTNGGATFPPGTFDVILPNGQTGQRQIPIFGPGLGQTVPNPVTGPDVTLFTPSVPTINDKGLFAFYQTGSFFFNVIIEALKDNGVARVLAEPNLTTLSGQEAKFLSGGEFPIPVAQGGATAGAVTIDFKEFGVGVNFLPVVLDSRRINLRVNTSVSEISSVASAAVGVTGTTSVIAVPSLTKRAAVSTVELSDGQTMGIAGLISDTVREDINKFPGLGDLPVLGHLFRSQEFQKSETELVIFVTPHLAGPTPPERVRLPTDAFVEPSDVEYYLLGRMEARPPSLPEAPKQGGLEGSFGHDL